ncbi:MAG: phosphoribosylformylglycinamidine cyclo-ligase [Deltaproteobacteria bacterium]|nr:phosphoribosylformylglycinamidine cyclo-ligase [Deltaproteobacteria bacterium]
MTTSRALQMATYKKSGVNIDKANSLVTSIKSLAQKTKRKEVISGIGGFAGLFSICNSNIKNPVLVATTDGVGTKLKIALEMNTLKYLGQDLVAMCVNDLICCGAEPLFFLDYYATGSLDMGQATTLIKSIAASLNEINCTLLGGETAEMPGLYADRDFDIAGFAVGIVDKNKIIDGSNVSLGSCVIGIESSGIHSNGYSLVRNIIHENKLDLNKIYDFSKEPLGNELLKPTQIYVRPVLKLLKEDNILAMAHITGGGLLENIPRVLPSQCRCVIDKKAVHTPEIFHFIQKNGSVPAGEMWRVFNMGVGFILVVKPADAEGMVQTLNAMNFKASVIGTIEKKGAAKESVEII